MEVTTYTERKFGSPTRDEVARRLVRPKDDGGDLDDAVAGDDGQAPDALANFSEHLRARMRALGWDQAQLVQRAGIKTPQLAARAINGTGCDLRLAGRIARVTGGDLAVMIGPYVCGTCDGQGRPGFICRECGKDVPLG